MSARLSSSTPISTGDQDRTDVSRRLITGRTNFKTSLTLLAENLALKPGDLPDQMGDLMVEFDDKFD